MAEDEKESEITKTGLTRRKFLAGSVGGAGAFAVAAGASRLLPGFSAQPAEAAVNQVAAGSSSVAMQPSSIPTSWDYTADVVVIGSGAGGMPAAIAARQAGMSVLVVEMNYDIGGHAMVSGGSVAIGGGNSVQVQYGIKDSPDLWFADLTSPAASTATIYGTRYVDRAICRVLADNSVPTFEWLRSLGVEWTDTALPNTPPSGGSSWVSGTARTNSPYYNGATTFPSSAEAPGGAGGTALMRPLEAAARSIGVLFLLNYRMTSVIREQVYSGRVLGVTAQGTGGRFVPGSTTPLQSYAEIQGLPGNISLQNANVNIRANRAVVLATGGHSSNILRRRECDPRLSAMYPCDGEPYSFQTGDGEYAARRIGAGMWGTGNQTAENDIEIDKPTYFGSAYPCAGVVWKPGSPIFPLVGATGIAVSNWSDVIHINMAGVRFVDESALSYAWIDPALDMNAASTGPEWSAGPVWMIFDSAAVKREAWSIGPPNTDPLFCFEANDLPTLAGQINTNPYQTTPMSGTTLGATVARYNSLVSGGKDTDFGKSAIQYQINTPPYYAASAWPAPHDSLSGLHINGQAQVLDLDGNIIQSLYAAGETAGGFAVHGLPKCLVFGRIAGTNAALEPSNA